MKNNSLLITFVVFMFIAFFVFIWMRMNQAEPAEDIFCGGIANIQCPDGYKCRITDTYPDAGGTCVR